MKLGAMRHLTKAVIVSLLVLMTASGMAGAQALAASLALSQPNNAGSAFTAELGLDQSDPMPPPTPTPSPVPPLPVP
jgi:hypothetical protein